MEKIEELKEGVVYVMENLNFLPDEHSYVSPWVEPEDETNKEQDEAKEEVDEAAKAALAKDPKKMSAAEKKKADEEAKKKAEEDSKAAEALAASADFQLERERQEEINRVKEMIRQ